MFEVFGKREEGQILLPPGGPVNTRFDCKSGQVKLGSSPVGTKIDIAILAARRWFGDLGMSMGKVWLQLFFVEAGTQLLPPATVCCAYLKGQSISSFEEEVVKVMARGIDPGHGIFSLAFQQQSAVTAAGEKVSYYSVTAQWRPRSDEQPTLEEMQLFLESLGGQQELRDAGERLMVPLDKFSLAEAEEALMALRELGGGVDGKLALPAGRED